ncbi:uncharacterized protein [Dendrobates tinctorius]|uniref:uncharacterized protein isoform X3 n=1 Tax=Dendrobates tinctorius TaxID=92724 RepID=UPI003CCA16BF
MIAAGMKTPMFPYIFLLIIWAAGGNATIRSHQMYRATGSSVTFPPVKITKEIVYDLRKLSHILIVTYHGSENVRPPYTHRVHFSSRTGEIEMRNLTEGDNGTYEQVVNMKVVAVIHLHVIDKICKKASSDLDNWSIIIFIFIVAVITIIVLGLVLGNTKCRTSRGSKSGHDSGESGDVIPEDASESGLPLLNTTTAGDGSRRTSPCDVCTNDERGPGEDENHDSLVEPPPEEDSPSRPDPGQCGPEGAFTMDPELSRASSDQEAVS